MQRGAAALAGGAKDRSQPRTRFRILVDIEHEFLAATDGLQARRGRAICPARWLRVIGKGRAPVWIEPSRQSPRRTSHVGFSENQLWRGSLEDPAPDSIDTNRRETVAREIERIVFVSLGRSEMRVPVGPRDFTREVIGCA